MKKTVPILLALCIMALVGCKDDVASVGADALGDDEEVKVHSMVFADMLSTTDTVSDFSITQTPDSFLLGECNTEEWGTIHADLLTQFACPEGFSYPDSSQVDSIALVMTYSSWFGDGKAPLRISVYEMDRGTFQYDHVYTSQEDLNVYWSGEDSTRAVQQDRTIVAAMPTDSIQSPSTSKYLPYIQFKMNERFVRKFDQLKKYPNQQAFNEFFKGLYLKTTYGASTALYVANITMVVYYHYYYQTEPGKYAKKNDNKYLYANTEVRQVNRYYFPYKKEVLANMKTHEDSLNFVVSPSYVYTVLRLPIQQYRDSIFKYMKNKRGETLRTYINKAMMRVDVLDVNTEEGCQYTKWASPANNLLLIVKDSLNDFFMHNRLPSPSYCMVSPLLQEVNGQKYTYYYNFDLSTMLQEELRHSNHSDQLEMVVVPVHVEYANVQNTSIISKIKVNQTITSTILYSAQNAHKPLHIDAVFSGFTIHSLQ